MMVSPLMYLLSLTADLATTSVIGFDINLPGNDGVITCFKADRSTS
jgi:hypothetical protein